MHAILQKRRTPGVTTVPNFVLLPIRVPEDPIAGEGNQDNDPSSNTSEFDVLKSKVSRLEGIGERNP